MLNYCQQLKVEIKDGLEAYCFKLENSENLLIF